MKKLLTLLLAFAMCMPILAQRVTDQLDRGLVAVPSSTGTGYLVSWRVLGEEYYDVTYNLYRDGSKIAENLSVSNYDDAGGSSTSSYQVSAVVQGVEQALCTAITPWTDGYKSITVATATDRNGDDASDYYTLNDVSLGDVNGDGVSEFIVKRPASGANDNSQSVRFNQLDCYDINGNRLWWIDLGPNMIAGPDEQWDCVAYDWDQDGKAEVLLRGADNMIIHYKKNGEWTTMTIGDVTVDTRDAALAAASQPFTWTGNEYLLYLNGETGLPYQIGPTDHPDYMTYPIARGSDGDWGYGVRGHRSTKHYFGAPFLDGRKASIFLGRGCYTQHKMVALDVDPSTHALTERWRWEATASGDWFGQGYHNFAIGDVDWDGRDEIIFGSMVIDDNGKGLSTTGLGHGDSQHCSDFDPYRKYEEQFACNEDKPAMNYRNAVTSELYYRVTASGDDGRALMGNFTNAYPGSVGRSINTGMVSSCSDKVITELGDYIPWGDLNSRIYWDGDLLDEYMDSPGTNSYAVVYKPGGGRLLNATGTSLTNSSKNNFCAQGDIFGDWREELVLRASDNNSLRVYTTGYHTDYRIPTLWSDHQYRNAMVWQSMGYNQTPHKSYFLGELEDITQAPPTNTMTGKTEVANGGSISTTTNHLIVCETNNTSISIPSAGASPRILEFNVPSWVQGSAESNSTSKGTDISYTYYTCNVTGGALTGTTRLVKEGEGILNLPAVTMTHTGNTDIWGGTVNFSGTMQSSPVWMNRHTTLNTTNGNFSSLKMEYGSTLNITTAVTVGTLELHEGARIKLNKDANGQIAITNLTLRNQKWQYGPKYLAPVIELTSSTTLEKGTKVQIGTVSGTVTGSTDDVVIETNTSLGQQGKLSVEDGKLYVTIDYDESLYAKTGTTSTIYERGYDTEWSTSDVTAWGGDTDATNGLSYGLYKTGGNGSNAATMTISPSSESNTINLEAYWMGMSNLGREFNKGNCSYFRYGNIWIMENDQDQAVAYSLDGGATYTTFGKNSTWADRKFDITTKNWMVIQIEIDKENNILNYLRVYSSSDLTSPLLNVEDEALTNADYTTIASGYRKGGSVSYSNYEYLDKIKVTESTLEKIYAGAQYTVKYVDESGTEIKDADTRMGVYGTTPTLEDDDTEDFFSSDESIKYVYVSNDVSIIAQDGSSVFTITFNKKYKYTVTAIDADDNTNVLKTIASGYVDDSESITVYYNHGINVDNNYYFISANSASPYYGTTVTKSNNAITLKYTANADVAYYAEGENMTLSRSYGTLSNDANCSGGGACGPYDGAHFYGDAVSAGRYTITVRGVIRKANDAAYTVRVSNDNETYTEKGTITFTKGATGEVTLANVDIDDNYFVDFLNGSGNANNYIDYVCMTRQKASYTVKFVDTDGNTLKTSTTHQGYIGTNCTPTEEDMANITSGDYTYTYSTYSASSTTIASDGSTVLTVKYIKRGTALEYVGESDLSTGWWGDFSSTYTLKDGEKYHFTFTNHNAGSGSNWKNWVLACVNGTGHSTSDRSDYAEHFILRNDNYAWGPEGNSGDGDDFKSLITMSSDFKWSSFVSDMNGSTVDMYVEYADSKVSMTSTITTTSGTKYNYSFSKKDITDDEVSVFFTVENAYLEITKAEKTVSVDEPTNKIAGTTTILFSQDFETASTIDDSWNTSTSGRYTSAQTALTDGTHYCVYNANTTNGATLTYSALLSIGTDYTSADNYKLEFDFAIIPTNGTSSSGAQTPVFTIYDTNKNSLCHWQVTTAAKTAAANSTGSFYLGTTETSTFTANTSPYFYHITINGSESGTVMTVEDQSGTSTNYTLSTSLIYIGKWTYYTAKNDGGLCLDDITLTTSTTSHLTLEPKSTDSYSTGIYDYVTVNRNFNAGYSSLCVPFNTTISEFTGRSNENEKAYYLTSATEESDGVYILRFAETDEIKANKPYIIYLTEALSAPTMSSKAVFAEDPKTLTCGSWSMTGNYTVNKSMYGLYGVANNASIMKGGSSSTLNGLTAFLTGPSNSQAKISFWGAEEEDTPTLIQQALSDNSSIEGIYSIDGRQQSNLSFGMNIVKMSDGTVRKVYVKH